MKRKVLATFKGKKLGYVVIDDEKLVTQPDIPAKREDSSLWKLDYPTTKNGVGDFEDLTDTYKKIYESHKAGITSSNTVIQADETNKFIEKCETLAGRKLTTDCYKNIVRQAKAKTPRLKINKYGRLFGKRGGKFTEDIWFKGFSND